MLHAICESLTYDMMGIRHGMTLQATVGYKMDEFERFMRVMIR